VSEVIRGHRDEIEVARRRIENAKPRAMPKNLVWALDLTCKTDLDGVTHFVLAILEHASRAALALEALESKSSWALMLRRIEAIKRYGKPCTVRTDNETVFTFKVFGCALFLLGIRHRRTDPGCPWQNGRVERFFGTLKERLDQLAVHSRDALNAALVEFRFFYNHVRPHQNLRGRTPAEIWADVDPFAKRFKSEPLVRSLGRAAQRLLPAEMMRHEASDKKDSGRQVGRPGNARLARVNEVKFNGRRGKTGPAHGRR
jgi:putative transposase